MSSWRGRATTRAFVGGALLLALCVAGVAASVPEWANSNSPVRSGESSHAGELAAAATSFATSAAQPTPLLSGLTAASTPPSSGPTASDSPSPGPTTSATGTDRVIEPVRTFISRPWLAWRPSGRGVVWMMELPAPWNDPSATTENISVYVPPGYNPNGSRRYPVLYEAPFDYDLWDTSIHFKSVLDPLIDNGTVPPMIVVFINAWRAPIYDTECANSVDGRQWMDTFISKTVVSYVDAHYRTIAQADARAFFGFSQGGYCAAILTLLHPSVFTTGISFSGYFRAGLGDESAKLPFGGDAAALDAASPVVVAAELPPASRAALLFIVVAKPSEPFFGTGAVEFEQVLDTEGYGYVALNSTTGHGWDQVRLELPAALEAWAARLVSVGVF